MTQVYTCYRNTVFILTLLTPSLHNMFRPPGPSSGESQTLSFLFLATDPEARVRFPALTEKKKNLVGLEQGALSLVSTTEELLDRKVAAPV
jgi:hypothetical protein